MPAARQRYEPRARSRVACRAATLLAALLASIAVLAADAPKKKEVTGKDLAFAADKGNCLACHAMPTVPDAVQPGNGGPPLIAMSARFPDRKVLRGVIWDATVKNPNSFMPPFGKHRVLTEDEIDQVLAFVYGL